MYDGVIISRMVDKGALKGFLCVDVSGGCHTLPLDQIKKIGSKIRYMNAEYDEQYGTLVGTHGNNLSKYPSVDPEYNVIGVGGLTLLFVVLDASTKVPAGAVVFSPLGVQYNVSFNKLNKLMRRYKPTNFMMETKTGVGMVPVMPDGTDFHTIEMTIRSANAGVTQLSSGGTIKQGSSDEIPVLKVSSFTSRDIDEEILQSASSKMFEGLLNMQYLTPYYHACLSAVDRSPAPGLGTFAVTESSMLYDPAFAASLSVPKLTFVLIHEICHIAMQHSVRFGVTRTDHELWNIACDLYINSVICKDFNILFGGDAEEVKISQTFTASIQTPDMGVFIETIGEKIDLATDTPETIYDRLLKENKGRNSKNGGRGKNNKNGGSSSGGSGSGAGGSGSSGDSKSAQQKIQEGINKIASATKNSNMSSQDKKEIQQAAKSLIDAVKQMMSAQNAESKAKSDSARDKAQQKKEQAGQAANNATDRLQDKSDKSGSQEMQSGVDSIREGLDQLQNGGQQGNQSGGQQGGQSNGVGSSDNVGIDNLSDSGDDGDFQQVKEVTVTYNGKKLKGTIMVDVLTSRENNSEQDNQEIINNSRQALQRIKTKIQIEEEERGEKLTKNAGAVCGLVQRYIEFGLSAGIRWQDLLKNLCKTKPKKTFTLASPNTDYMSMGMTIADRRAIGRPTHISQVKFCIDVSGSVSQKELMFCLSEINNIFTHYKMDAELIYWSTMVGNAGKFSSMKDMLKVDAISDGGTDVRCVFDYLSGKTKVNGKLEEDRMRDIKAIFILTDGYFSKNYEDYANVFGKKVVWLVTGNPVTFSPAFGRVVGFELPG